MSRGYRSEHVVASRSPSPPELIPGWNGKRVVRLPSDGPIIAEMWYRDGKLHRDQREGPAGIMRDRTTGNIKLEEYFNNGELHRDPRTGPAYIERDPRTGIAIVERYVRYGRLHRKVEAGPAAIRRDACTGKVIEASYWLDGKEPRLPKKVLKKRAGHLTPG